MKSWVVYLISFFYISSVTPVSQIYKLPVFVSHFIEHDEGRGFGTEMINFLTDHYLNTDFDEEWTAEHKLPFLKIEITQFDQISIPVFRFLFPEFKKDYRQERVLSYNDENLYSYYLNTIWQPPKQA